MLARGQSVRCLTRRCCWTKTDVFLDGTINSTYSLLENIFPCSVTCRFCAIFRLPLATLHQALGVLSPYPTAWVLARSSVMKISCQTWRDGRCGREHRCW